MANKFRHLLVACCLLSFRLVNSVQAENENILIPGSAHEIKEPMEREFDQPIAHQQKLEELASSSEVTLKVRNYYLNRARPDATDPYGWAQGGILGHKMGRVGGVFSMNTELMGSFPLDAPQDHSGTFLLDKNQHEITTFGVVNPRLTYAGQVLSMYRQRYSLPFLNEQDNRMLPNTFEGYTIAQPIASSKTFQYIAGYVSGIKKRDSEQFIAMSDAAGASQVDRGVLMAGARAFVTEDLNLSAINYYLSDIYNIVYADSNYKTTFCDDIEQTFSAQYANQTTVGNDLLTGDSYSTGFWGAQSVTSYEGFVFKAALTVNEKAADIKSAWGSYAGYNSSLVEDFNRAGENASQVALTYDLSKIGLDGFKIATAYIQGNNAVSESTGEALADKREADVTLDYRVTKGLLNGFWVRLRSATIDDEKAGTTQDYRVIVNYDVVLFSPPKSPTT